MSTHFPPPPKWLERALQGLTFWIGHRHALFPYYPLTEGALVAESCNLIQANLFPYHVLFPECLYKNLVKDGRVVEGVGSKARADLVVCSAGAKKIGREGNISAHTRFVVEVKRGDARLKSIDEDLRRLQAYLLVATPGTRCFLVVVSESLKTDRFVRDGRSRAGSHPIPGCSGYFRVRRTVKAAASFSAKKSAHYASLIEIYVG